jgi:prevent-host-death family protein
MKTVTMHEAKTHLSRLVREAIRGEEIVIARGDEPLVRLVPLASARGSRVFGSARGAVRWSDDFAGPLPDFDEYR